MPASRSEVVLVPPAAAGWVEDTARGRRQITRDPLGRIAGVTRADGTRVSVEYDELGRIRVLDADGTRIETDIDSGPTTHMHVHDAGGVTHVGISADGWSLTRVPDASSSPAPELSLERDGSGRVARVRIPGSAAPLEFDHGPDGCVLRHGGRIVARMTERAERRRWRIGAGVMEERAEGTRWTLSAHAVGSDGRSVALQTDLLGRTIRRAWCDGRTEEFARDAESRLTMYRVRQADDLPWVRTDYEFNGGELARIHGASGSVERRTDAAGRVTALVEADGTGVRYEYDVRGRRVATIRGDAVTRYGYDGLDHLVRITRPDGRTIACAYDGLGRRVLVRCDAEDRFEHRDADGRLWAVTDADGRAIATYVWFEGRILLQVHGALDSQDRTGYLCDPTGTPLLAIRCDGAASAVPSTLPAAPYGTIGDALRPTLYGHVGDPLTGLIHCGARELDPESATFLTPEPWHGGPDDERRFGETYDRVQDAPLEGGAGLRHDYALCRFDPVGRADYDGHVSGGAIVAGIFRGLGNLILGPTWGMPLTSISLFFFLPFNLYMEVVAGIIAIFIQRHPWANHSIFGLRGAFASARQAQISLALNGFLPRVISGGGIGADRAVTIGNVVWIHRHELSSLNRPLVVELDGIDGGGGLTAFNVDPGKESILGLDIVDSQGKHRIHGAYWTRGFGTAIKTVGAGLAFEDTGGRTKTTVHLSAPVPLDWDPPTSAKDKQKLVVREYLRDPAAPRNDAVADVVDDVWFALKLEQNKKEKLKNGDAIEIEAAESLHLDHAHMVIGRVQDLDDFSLLFLVGELPARFRTAAVKEEMIVHRIADDTSVTATAGWEDVGGRTVIEAPAPAGLADWPPNLAKDDLVKVKAATAAPATPTLGLPGAPANIDTIHARVKGVTATLEFAEALLPGFGATTTVTTMTGKGKVQAATLKAVPGDIEFADGPSGLSNGDYVSVKAGAVETFAKLTDLNGKAATLSILGPSLGAVPPAALQVRRLVDKDGDDDPKGTAPSPTGTSFAMEVPRLKPFVPGLLLHLKDGANEAIRALARMSKAQVTLSDEVVGTKPFTVSGAKRDTSLCRIKDVERPALRRFLRHVSGSQPGAFGKFPDDVLQVRHPGGDLRLTAFFVKDAPNLDPSYTRTWSPLQFGTDHYFVLDEDLPIAENDDSAGNFIWKFDPDEPNYGSYRWRGIGAKPAGGFQVHVREFHTTGAVRGVGGDAPTAHAAEVVVPADPQFCYALGDALEEHEMHHTLQGNYWGPLLGAFPLQAIILNVVDIADVRSDAPDWFKSLPGDFFRGIHPLQTFSIGGIMFMAWKFLFLGPAHISSDASDTILEANFATMNRFFNPFWGNLIDKFPSIEPNLPLGQDDFGTAFVRFLARAMDLRSWTPFLGFVPTWLPDGPQNPIEQGASRMSGDLYSTIVSTDDRFNAKLAMRIADGAWKDDHGADRTKALGSVFRLMVYPGDRWERVFPYDRANCPSGAVSSVVYNEERSVFPLVSINAPVDTLFHPDLYQAVGAVAPTVTIEAPRSIGGTVDFLKFPATPPGGSTPDMQPRLRTLVPLPPRILRTAGVYFMAAQPGVYEVASYDSRKGQKGDAETWKVSLTVGGAVHLGDDDIPWQAPVAHPAVPAAPLVERFITERPDLQMKDPGDDVVPTKGYEAQVEAVNGTAAPKAALTASGKKWELVVGDATATLRVRIFRIFRKNDTANDANNEPAFDLHYDGVPGLKNVRSYLEKDLWVPVRDFIVDVKALPVLPARTIASDAHVDVPIAIPVEASAFTITPPAGAPRFPTPEKQDAKAPPRGNEWRFGPLDTLVEDPTIYKVEVKFGTGGITSTSTFDLTVEPVITLKAAAFEATKGTPLELAIDGGTLSFSVDTDDKPDGTTVTIDSAARTVTVTVNDAPALSTTFVVTVKDDRGKKGRRTVTVK